MDCCDGCWFFLPLLAVFAYAGLKYLKKRHLEQKWKRWENTPKDLVILHGFARAKTIPNGSPFVLKLATYLRMANIKHKVDSGDVIGPKGKAPWITLNGQHYADSQMIIEMLNKKFEKRLNNGYVNTELASARAIRVMMEEHAFWGIPLQRFVYDAHKLDKVQSIPLPWMTKRVLRKRTLTNTWFHGLGRHNEQEVFQLMRADLETVSLLLGSKKFILGDKPCEEDCGIFAQMAEYLWGLADSPYETVMTDEFPNLKAYCERMRELFWPDWDEMKGPVHWTWEMIWRSALESLV